MNIQLWGANEWQVAINGFLAVAAICGGLWAIFSYRKSRRNDAARWLHNLYKDFYFDNRFRTIRYFLEYRFEKVISPLLKRRVDNPEVEISRTEAKILAELDDLLNYFEYVSYLEIQGHLLKDDREAIFEYWFDMISTPKYTQLKRYIIKYGYKQLARVAILSKKDKRDS